VLNLLELRRAQDATLNLHCISAVMQKNLSKLQKKNIFMINQAIRNIILSKIMQPSLFIISRLVAIFLFILTTTFSLEAQEYATDRLFMKEFGKTKCRNLVENKIKSLKLNPVMTLEQEALLNQNVWSKLRLKLPLSPGEKLHLRKLKQKGIYSNKLSTKNIWARNAEKFKGLRHKCK
jgi:hypothetical protein